MRRVAITLFFLVIFLYPHAKVHAIEDPRSHPNNIFGVHILFDNELRDAAKMINSNGGDWGYITIPIQMGDRDLEKWQNFMDQARELHLIPLIRLASEGDYFNTKVWRKPTTEDVMDFANFLNSLEWPTKNRYVIIFNEVNRGDEWGGIPNPAEYADLLSYAVTIFKSKSDDFFMISAGLDNAAPDQGAEYMNQYDFLRRMQTSIPGIFNQIDGISSHSYPNPAFAQPPSVQTTKSITSFKYEKELVEQFSTKDLPIFITETGWSADTVSDEERALYYNQAFSNIWTDEDVVAVTPFLLRAGDDAFRKFSFLDSSGGETKQYLMLQKYPKTRGIPSLTKRILGVQARINPATAIKDFPKDSQLSQEAVSLSELSKKAFSWIMKL